MFLSVVIDNVVDVFIGQSISDCILLQRVF